MLTRRASVDFSSYSAHRVSKVTVPLITEELFELSPISKISKAQSQHPKGTGYDFQLVQMENIYVWVNDAGQFSITLRYTQIKIRICVADHYGLGGDRGASATKQIINGKVTWPTTQADLDGFVKGCFLCLLSSGGQKDPR